MKRVVAVVSTVLLSGSLAVGQSTSASGGSTKPTNVSEPDSPKPATENKNLDTSISHKKGKKDHKGAKKAAYKGGTKSQKGDKGGQNTSTPK